MSRTYRFIENGEEQDYFFSDEGGSNSHLLYALFTDWQRHLTAYCGAIDSARSTLSREADRMSKGAIKSDNELGILQNTDVDRLAGVVNTSLKSLHSAMRAVGVVLVAAVDPYDLKTLQAEAAKAQAETKED